MSCEEPAALFMRELINVKDLFFFVFLVRVRCRRKKFTFAISSAEEFLVLQSAFDLSAGWGFNPPLVEDDPYTND